MAWSLLHADTGTRSDRELDGDTMSDAVGTWSGQGAGNWAISSNQIAAVGAVDAETAYDSAMSSAGDQKAEAKVHVFGGGVICRRSTNLAYYLAYSVPGTGALALYYYNSGFTQIGTGGTLTTGDTMAIEAIGTTIALYKNGASQISVTDATHSVGVCGLYGSGVSALFTDFADYIDAGGSTTRGVPFGSRGVAFNGGRTFMGILR